MNYTYLDNYGGRFEAELPATATITLNQKCSTYTSVTWNTFITDTSQNMIMSIYGYDGNYIDFRNTNFTDATTFKQAMKGVLLQYELADNLKYEDELITNQPLNTLDQKGSMWLREEWLKGLNLYNGKVNGEYWDISTGETDIGSNWARSYKIAVKPNTTYYLSFSVIDGSAGYLLFFDLNGNYLNSSIETPRNLSFTTNSNTYFIAFYSTQPTMNGQVMLVEGSHAYPYQEYNGKIIHEKDLPVVTPTHLYRYSFSLLQANEDYLIYLDCYSTEDVSIATLQTVAGMRELIGGSALFNTTVSINVSGFFKGYSSNVKIQADKMYIDQSGGMQLYGHTTSFTQDFLSNFNPEIITCSKTQIS